MDFIREPSHLILIGVIVVVLFGSRRLPDAARGLGQSMRIFKTEMKAMKTEDKPATSRPTAESAEAPLEGRVVRPTATTPAPTQTPYVDEPVHETPRNL
jgi:sec-independent protein translocase protein TatA